jgi:D-alanyl-D-alanine carboxypeptidase
LDGDFMQRKNLASSRLVRVSVFGLVTLASAAVFTTDSAEARRHHHSSHHASHHSIHNDSLWMEW